MREIVSHSRNGPLVQKLTTPNSHKYKTSFTMAPPPDIPKPPTAFLLTRN